MKLHALWISFFLFCNSTTISAEELSDYYWQMWSQYGPSVGNVTFGSPEPACAMFLREMRSKDANNTFDWQMGQMVYSTPGSSGYPSVGCTIECGPNKVCSGGSSAMAYASKHTNLLDEPHEDEVIANECTDGPNPNVRNPINPASGNKHQHEPLLQFSGATQLALDLYYNSSQPERWRHNYSRSVMRASDTQLPAESFKQTQFCADSIVVLESAGGFSRSSSYPGQSVSNYPASSNKIYATATRVKVPQTARNSAQDACALNWSTVRNRYHASWVANSTAQYLPTGECVIFDVNNVERMRLNVYRDIGGMQWRGSADLYSCADFDPTIPPALDSPDTIHVRFTRQKGDLVRFEYDATTQQLINISNTGEKAEFIVNGTDVTGYRFYSMNDDIEVYDANGKLLSITLPDGMVQNLTYEKDAVTDVDLLTRVTGSTGEYIEFFYELVEDVHPFKRLSSVVDYTNRTWEFRYNANDMLESVVMPDSVSRQYHYEDLSDTSLLTGITDERNIRYATWGYNTNKKAVLSAHGLDQDIEKSTIVYNENNNNHTVTNIRKSGENGTLTNIAMTYASESAGGSKLVASITGNIDVQYEIDPVTGRRSSMVENGIRTEYGDYNENGVPGFVIEAAGTTDARRVDYTYDPRFHNKVATITEPSVFAGSNKITSNTYDDFGNTTSKTINGFRPDGTAVERITGYTYTGPFHQLSEINGPRTDVNDLTTINYYLDDVSEGNNRARMKSVIKSLNQIEADNIQWTATGKMQNYTTGNNLQVTFTYYPGNDRLESIIQTDTTSSQSNTTHFTYLATGETRTVTSAYGSVDATSITLDYDDGRRLTRITDGLGNFMEYVLDSEGNIEKENIHDATSVLKKTLTQTFDLFNRLDVVSQANETSDPTFAPDGTLDTSVDGNGTTTDYSYDALRRLTKIEQDTAGINATTNITYDKQDNLTTVTDPVNGTTTYVYDDLGNLLSQTSPDTGTTSYTHDAAGNVTSTLDAKNQLTTYSYDALNRLTSIDAPGTDDDFTYSYDSCSHGAGKLCSVTSASSSVSYAYDAFGNTTAHQALAYSHDAANRTRTVTYPSGAIVTYSYDAAGQVNLVELTRNGTTVALASNIVYAPFGDINGLSYGNGLSLNQAFDTAYRTTAQTVPGKYELEYRQYDANGNLKQRDDLVSSVTDTFLFDRLDRLDIANGVFGARDYDYDKNGNRTQLNDGTVTSYAYDTNSNRMNQNGPSIVLLDANGNTTNDGNRSYTHNSQNRILEVFDSGVLKATYSYNGLGQRISKTVSGLQTQYIYGTDGLLLAESNDGVSFTEYFYLNKQLLAMQAYSTVSTKLLGIANALQQLTNNATANDANGLLTLQSLQKPLKNNKSEKAQSNNSNNKTTTTRTHVFELYYVHNDHLGTPKAMTDELGIKVWGATHDPFGKATVDVGSSVELNVRFVGQYYDQESGLHYNYFRYMEPSTGRFITSDPIGLRGGINTYTYVRNNPLRYIDPFGLLDVRVGPDIGGDPVNVPFGGEGTGLPESTITFDPQGPNETNILPGIPGSLTIDPKTDGVEIEYNGDNIRIKIKSEEDKISGQCEVRF